MLVYFVDMSHIVGKLTTPPPDPRPDPLPPASHPLGGGVPSTPTTVDQAYGTNGGSADAIPLMMEIFRDVKNIFKVSAATAFTKGTGGEQFPFTTSHGLEQAISRIGDEIHSQYLITYTPNNRATAASTRLMWKWWAVESTSVRRSPATLWRPILGRSVGWASACRIGQAEAAPPVSRFLQY
ncbi:MAG: hypothetical protein WDO73_10720 [Ignavibacteriota bacterium]